jgi:hypothetical protein
MFNFIEIIHAANMSQVAMICLFARQNIANLPLNAPTTISIFGSSEIPINAE